MKDLSRIEDKAVLAAALHAEIRRIARVCGYNPDDVLLIDPERGAELGVGRAWRVMWEGGPFEWGIDFSIAADCVHNLEGAAVKLPRKFYLEPHYSFDVGIYDV